MPWCWERLKAGGERDDRGWDGWMASPTQWTWVWASSGSWCWTGKPGVLQSLRSQSVEHYWVPELNWNDSLSTNAEEAEVEWFYEDLQDLEQTPFHHRGLEWKSRKSSDTWSNRQVGPWSTFLCTWSAEQKLTEFCQGNALVIANTLFQQYSKGLHMDIMR